MILWILTFADLLLSVIRFKNNCTNYACLEDDMWWGVKFSSCCGRFGKLGIILSLMGGLFDPNQIVATATALAKEVARLLYKRIDIKGGKSMWVGWSPPLKDIANSIMMRRETRSLALLVLGVCFGTILETGSWGSP